MKLKILAAVTLFVLVSGAAYAGGVPIPGPAHMPEIDALSGLAALAVVGASLALIRERVRKR